MTNTKVDRSLRVLRVEPSGPAADAVAPDGAGDNRLQETPVPCGAAGANAAQARARKVKAGAGPDAHAHAEANPATVAECKDRLDQVDTTVEVGLVPKTTEAAGLDMHAVEDMSGPREAESEAGAPEAHAEGQDAGAKANPGPTGTGAHVAAEPDDAISDAELGAETGATAVPQLAAEPGARPNAATPAMGEQQQLPPAAAASLVGVRFPSNLLLEVRACVLVCVGV